MKAYLDGSGHGDTKSTFVTLSGFVGTPDAWSDFEMRGGNILAQHGAPYLHMVEAMHCGGAFSRRNGWTRERVYALLKDLFNQCLTKLKRDEFVGLSCTVDLVAHGVVKAEGKKLRSAEALCADYCVDVALKIARLLHGPATLPSGSVEVFFDRYEPYEPWAKRAWTRKRSAPWWADAVASMPSADWRVVMGLQAADMTAWAFNRRYTRQDDWVSLFASIVKAQFHQFYGEVELRALP